MADKYHKRNDGLKPASPFGDIHPVEDLEGIGPIYNKALLAMG